MQHQGQQITLPEQEIHFVMQLQIGKRLQNKMATNGISVL